MQLKALDTLPSSTSEVGEGNRCRLVLQRETSQVTDDRPFSEVIDVHIEGQTIAHAVDQTIVHDEVHTAVTTDLLSLLSDLLLDGVLVLLHQLISGSIADVVVALEVFVVRYSLEVLLRGTESIAFVGVLVSEAVGTDDLIHTVVWALCSR